MASLPVVHMVVGVHNPPRRLHLQDCDHLSGTRDPQWRVATVDELATIPTCIHCAQRVDRVVRAVLSA